MEHRNKDDVVTIQDEYRRIDGKWLRMQQRLMVWLTMITACAEAVMFFVLRRIGALFLPTELYWLKYLLAPLVCNLALCAAAALLIGSRLPGRKKIYAVSFLMTVMATVVYTAHSNFYALVLIFAIPMLLTTVYGDQLLTGVTGLGCVTSKVCSDLFLPWNPMKSSVLDTPVHMADFGLSVVLLTLFYGVCHVLLKIEREKNTVSISLERERQRYLEESVTDALTRVGNRQALRAAFSDMETAGARQRFFLAMMDLDDFKSLNDTYGHTHGDQYLRSLGAVLKGLATERVLPFRFGGDEFCVLFRDCEPEAVRAVCLQIQERFQHSGVHQVCRPVSVSIGVAEYQRPERPAQLLDRADTALYQAKLQKGSVHFT